MNGIAHSGNLPAHAAELQRIASAFGRAAAGYDLHAELQRDVARGLLSVLEPGQHRGWALDLGCGTGFCSTLLSERLPQLQVLAVDVAEPMLHVLQRRELAPVTPLCADAEFLPLADCSVDLVVSSLALQWCGSPLRLFRELRRVARPGARLLLSTLGPGTLAEVRAAWQGLDDAAHVNEFVPPERLRLSVLEAGLRWQCRTETRIRYHDSLRAVAKELRGIGARISHAARPRGLTTRDRLDRAEALFARGRETQGIPVSWEVLYLDLLRP